MKLQTKVTETHIGVALIIPDYKVVVLLSASTLGMVRHTWQDCDTISEAFMPAYEQAQNALHEYLSNK
jgi:hypothetical protein